MVKSLRVLVVEDSEDDVDLLVRELRRSGYDPVYERVESAEAMQTALDQQSWDLVVADYTMPRFNALAALALLKESGLDVPFIIISGTIGEERAVAAMKAGAHDYLTKGHLARLAPVVERELREARVRQEHRQAEEALRDRERYFRALIENTSDVITTLDAAGRITYASPALFRVLGFMPAEHVGLNAFDIGHPEDMQESAASFRQLLQQPGASAVTQFRAQHKNGSWHLIEATSRNLLHEPGIQAVVTNLRDITERRRLEDQLLQAQKMEAIGQLTAGIAHDFNNLLTAINGFAGLLQLRLPADDPQRKTVGKILNAGERAANLISQLLAFSRKQIVSPEVIELNAIVARMDKMLTRIIGEHIRVSFKPAPDLWPIKADPTQIEQVIVNLAVNARDAMPSGGKLIIETQNVVLEEDFIASHLQAQPGPHVLLAVSDTGAGMTEEVKAHLFEPFFTTKEPGRGTGLGLAMIYGIVKQSGGSIWVYSEVDHGTVFKIYLPRAEPAERPLPNTQDTTEKPSGDETILVAEDADDVRDLIRQVLQESGYTVLAAQNGREALQLSNNYPDPIHLLLTDIVMPGLSGRGLAEQVIKTRPELKVLFMSGYAGEAIANHGVLDPDIFLLQKPFGPRELARKVWEVLNETK